MDVTGLHCETWDAALPEAQAFVTPLSFFELATDRVIVTERLSGRLQRPVPAAG